MAKTQRTYTAFLVDPHYFADGSRRILENMSCGHKHKAFRGAWRCKYNKFDAEAARIRENTSGRINCEGRDDDFRVGYKTCYIDGKLFYKDEKLPVCPPEIAKLFDNKIRYALTPQELMVIDLKLINLPWSLPYDMPYNLRSEGLTRLLSYWREICVTDENPFGTKSLENTCGTCGKTGFQKIMDPRTLDTHNQTCDACGGGIMIDSYYYSTHFAKTEG